MTSKIVWNNSVDYICFRLPGHYNKDPKALEEYCRDFFEKCPKALEDPKALEEYCQDFFEK